MTTPAISAAAHAVAEAEAAHAAAADALAQASTHTAHVRRRCDDLAAQRQAIVARRAAGDPQADDGAKLALIGADAEALVDLLREAEAAEAAARTPADAAQRSLAGARELLIRAEAEAEEEALIAHARQLDHLLLQTSAAIMTVSARLGRPVPRWGASPDLRDRIRRIALLRQEL